MPRKPKHQTISCEFLTWRIFTRDGVYYADGRGGKYDLGKHSLGTRDRDEALERLKQLDRHKAVELGLTDPKTTAATEPISIAEGWKQYLEFSGRSPVLGGVSTRTLKRYRAVRDKHFEFCRRNGIADWVSFDARMLERYGNWLSKDRADRTVYFELTLLKSVNSWLIKNKHLPPDSKLIYPLRKPQGTDTYCYSRSEVSAMVGHCRANPKARLAGVRDHRAGAHGPADQRACRPTLERRRSGARHDPRRRRTIQPPQAAGGHGPDHEGPPVADCSDSFASQGTARDHQAAA